MYKKLFLDEGIEYAAALPISSVNLTRAYLLTRIDGFSPRAVILFLVPYYTGETENLSRYAASEDYHLYMRGLIDRMTTKLYNLYPENQFYGFADHSPIDEREAAVRAGLGIFGKNGLLLNESYGSYVFLGEIFTDLAAESLGFKAEAPLRACADCGACRRACPTGILRGEGDDCLSAITQKKGSLTEREIALMRKTNTVWGCDLCQTVCPYNQNARPTPIAFFHENRTPHLTLEQLDAMDDAHFSRRAYAWRGRETVRRNLLLLSDT